MKWENVLLITIQEKEYCLRRPAQRIWLVSVQYAAVSAK